MPDPAYKRPWRYWRWSGSRSCPPRRPTRTRRLSRSGTRRWCGWSPTPEIAGRRSRTSRSTSTCSSASRRSRCAGRGAPTTWSRSAPTANELSKPLPSTTSISRERARPRAATTCSGQHRLTAGQTPAVYAHVATEPGFPGQLALQYWFYYVFNDWNNTHEGDWEKIQLVFDADGGVRRSRASRCRSATASTRDAEEATWGDDKLELVDGTHPVVHPAAGSHANFFESSALPRQLGRGGRRLRRHIGPDLRRPPGRANDPERCDRSPSRFPGSGSRGAGVSCRPAFFNGPTGPNLKTSVDGADQLVEGLARPELHRPGRWCVRHARRPASSAARSVTARTLVGDSSPTRSSSVCCSERSLCSSLPALANTLAADRAAPPRTPSSVGPDPRVRGPDVRPAPTALPRDRPLLPADLVARDAPAGARPARDERRRRPDRGRERRDPRPRPRGRHGADAARTRTRRGGDGAGAGRDRRTARPVGPLGAYRLAFDGVRAAVRRAR